MSIASWIAIIFAGVFLPVTVGLATGVTRQVGPKAKGDRG